MNPCRSCGAHRLQQVLDLGSMPLVNALWDTRSVEGQSWAFPLQLFFCGACSLVQIGEEIPPESMFSDYSYFSSYSETMLRHAEALATSLSAARRLDRKSLVIEIASNDGYLLQYYRRAGIPVLGIEPAANVAAVAETERQISTLVEFFGEELAERLFHEGRSADVVHAHNVLAHVPDLNGFLRGVARILKPDGVFCVEVPYVRDLVERCEFDTIYHEHLCYFSLTALVAAFRRSGLAVTSVERVPIHGGSLRVLAARSGASVGGSVMALLGEEAKWGVRQVGVYLKFAERARALRDQLHEVVTSLRSSGKSVAAYGASAKGCVLLNYANLSHGEVDFVVDRSPHKQGRFVPGVGVPISAPSRLLEEMPDHVLLLAWNLASEVLSQQQEYRRRGGGFIVPVPEVRFVP